ncbi:MAG TPA: hypothetical protein V6C52_13405 [Coleofasciculaceae cyanobacterium]|jgi:hypothetical protein
MGLHGIAGGRGTSGHSGSQSGKSEGRRDGKEDHHYSGKFSDGLKKLDEGKKEEGYKKLGEGMREVEQGKKELPPGIAQLMAEGRFPSGLQGGHGDDNDDDRKSGGGRADSFRSQAPSLVSPQAQPTPPANVTRPAPITSQVSITPTPAPAVTPAPSQTASPAPNQFSGLLTNPLAGSSIGTQLLNTRVQQPARAGSQIIDASVLNAARGGDTVGFINALAGNVNANLNGSVQQFLALTS